MAGIYRINIDQQRAEIGVRTTPAKIRITTPRPKMRITSQAPKLEIERRDPKFRVNRRKINSESGLKAPLELAKVHRDNGRSGALQGTSAAVNDGNFLGETRRQGDRVGQLAKNKTMSAILKKKEANIGLMPKERPEVVWDKGSLSINWSRHSVIIDWDGEYMPRLTVDPKHSIEVYLRKEPYFRVTVEEMTDPGGPGRYVDRAI